MSNSKTNKDLKRIEALEASVEALEASVRVLNKVLKKGGIPKCELGDEIAKEIAITLTGRTKANVRKILK